MKNQQSPSIRVMTVARLKATGQPNEAALVQEASPCMVRFLVDRDSSRNGSKEFILLRVEIVQDV